MKGSGILLDCAPLDGFLEGAAPIQPGARAVLVPSFAHQLVVVELGIVFRLQVGQAHFFPQPIHDVVDVQFEQQPDFAFAMAAFARFRAGIGPRRMQHIAGLAFALAGFGAGGGAIVVQAEARMLQEVHRNLYRALLRAGDDVRMGDQVGQVFLHRFAHLLVMPQPIAGTARKQFIPRCFRAISAVMSHNSLYRRSLAMTDGTARKESLHASGAATPETAG